MIPERTRRLMDQERLQQPERANATPAVRRDARGPRSAYCKVAAGSGNTIVCYLDTDATGTEITVTCKLSRATNLSDCFPLLQDGEEITVYNDNGTWKSYQTFIGQEECT